MICARVAQAFLGTKPRNKTHGRHTSQRGTALALHTQDHPFLPYLFRYRSILGVPDLTVSMQREKLKLLATLFPWLIDGIRQVQGCSSDQAR